MKFESFHNAFVFLGCIVMLCVSGWFVLDVETEKYAIKSFNEVVGVVISCDDQVHYTRRNGSRHESHSYRCVYEYEVSGRRYKAEQTVPQWEISSSMSIPQSGGAVTVYYKPSMPDVSRVFIREVPKFAVVIMLMCIVGVWLACPFKFKIPMLFFGDAEASAKHPWISFFVYVLAMVLLAKLLVMSGCSGCCSRTDPETGDVWGP